MTRTPFWLIVALAELAPLQRDIVLRAVRGETYRQIGNALGLTRGVVGGHSSAAMTTLNAARP